MSQKAIDLLMEKKQDLKLGGGETAIQKQHEKGKLTARERLDLLFDEGSFVETGLFVSHRCTNFGMEKKKVPADAVITGYGLVNGRLVFVSSQDFTVIGGSLGEMHAEKIAKAQEAALKAGAPFVCINDSGGARIQEGIDALNGFGKLFYNNVQASGVIPQISVIMGPCAGGAVYSPALTDFIFMVDKTGNMFITGPQVIKTVTGEDVSTEALGGAAVHASKSGVAHYFEGSEETCIADVKRLLSFLPQNNLDSAPVYASTDDMNREDPALDRIVPDSANAGYDMTNVIRSLADGGDFMPYMANYARNILTGFLRMGGKTAGVIASQPNCMAGCLDIDASDKAARFIRFCDAFHIPLLTLVDVPGFLPGTQQEHGGIIRHGAKLLYAYSEATVPMVTVITRKAYGGAYIGMCSKSLGADYVYAWPTAEIAVMGAEGAANIVSGKEIRAAEDPAAKRAEKVAEYQETFMNPYVAASRGYVDDVILPRETRKYILSAFQAMEGKKVSRPKKKHGNIPL